MVLASVSLSFIERRMPMRQLVASVVKHQIGDHRDADRDDVAPVEREQQRADDQRELDDGRHRDQHRGADDRLDGVAAALEHAGQAAGLALQVKTQRQAVQVDEDLDRQPAHRIHRHGGEQRVAPLLGQRHHDAQDAVEDGQRDRAEKSAGRGTVSSGASPATASVAHL